MVDPIKIREHISILANGSSLKIINEMDQKVREVVFLVKTVPDIKQYLRADINFSLKQLPMLVKHAEKIALPIDSLNRRLKSITETPDIKHYYSLQEKLQQNPSSRERGLLQQEMQRIKSVHSTSISKINSLQQQILVSRLNLIQCWKSLVSEEIGILDELKTEIVKYILKQAEESDDSAVLQYVREQLESIQKAFSSVSSSLTDKFDFHLGNIKFLKDSMKIQLQKVVQIEKAICEREETFDCLIELAERFKNNLEETTIDALKSTLKISRKNEGETSNPKIPEIPQKQYINRMVYQSRKKYT